MVKNISTVAVISEIVDDGLVKIVSKSYTGVDTDNISVTVDNKNFTISAEILQVQYDSILEFPNIGSAKLLYVDTSDNAVYRWDADSLTYVCVGRDYVTDERFEDLDTLIEMMKGDEFGKVDDVQVNGSSVVADKIASVTIGTLTTSTASQSSGNTESFTDSIVLHKVAKTGEYTDLLNAPSVINSLDSASTTDALSAYQGSVLQSMVQGIEFARAYENISSLVTALNGLSADVLHVGENLFIQTLNVPDFWVVAAETTSSTYTYTSDEDFVADVQANTSVQVGYYKISLLETAKVDLSDYYTSSQVDNLLSGYVTSTVFSTTLEDYAKTADVTTTLGNYVTNSDLTVTLDNYYTKTEIDTTLTGYVTTEDLENAVDGIDLSGYVTNTTFNTTLANYVTSETLDSYATTEYVDNAVSNVSVDLSGYYTKTEVDTALEDYAKTESLSSYATTEYVDGLIGDISTVLDTINGEEV